MSGVLASQAFEKLVFIHVFRYSVVDLGGVEWPPHINLRHISSSQSGGEKSANQGSIQGNGISIANRISSRFGGAARAVGAGVIATTMALSAPAFANDGPTKPMTTSASLATMSGGFEDLCVHVEGYSEKSCASEGYETPMTLDEILGDHDLNRDRVILHFGDGIIDADLAAIIMNDKGVAALAIPGGPENGIQLILSGKVIKSTIFTQSHINRSELTVNAPILLKRVQERQAAQRATSVQQTAYIPSR